VSVIRPQKHSRQPARSPVPSAPVPAQEQTPLGSMLAELRIHGRRRGLWAVISTSFASGLEALWGNRTRSILTILGIFIGVAAVIAALTLVQGVNAYITNLISKGGNTVYVFPFSRTGTVSQGRQGNSITVSTAQSLQRLPHVSAFSPIISQNSPVVYGNQNWTTQVQGVTSDIQTIQDWQVAEGNWFGPIDESQGTAVAVLGDTVYHNLFDTSGDDPIGKQIRIGRNVFRVVGVLAPQGGFLTQDDVIFIPFKTMQLRLNNTTYVQQVYLQSDTAQNVDQVTQEVTRALEKANRITDPSQDNFTVISSTQILQQIGQSNIILEGLLIGIAAISLTVGGVGIMNIMLVSVTERTWEIGIRMSIGARRRDILSQFLVEALLLCGIGGLMGLGLGLLIGKLVTGAGGLPFVITPFTLLLPFMIAVVISLVFGLYPAIRAARLDPIVAIRTEE